MEGERQMDLRWDDLKLFLAVHEHGSLSAAARALKLGQPTLSRRIAELEEAVNETLFERKSQGAQLTAAGQKLLPAAQRMAEWANEASLNIKKHTHLPQGKVRIAAPPGIAYEVVVPVANKIRQQHPQIQIEVLSGIEVLNLGRGEADISLRSEKPSDADLVCIDEIASPMRVYASKDYAAKLLPSPTLADLDWICWAAPYEDLPPNPQLHAAIPNFKPVFTSDDYIVKFAACKVGIGAMILPQILHGHTGQQTLQELNIDLGPQAIGHLYVVCHKRHRHLPKVRLVTEFITKEFDRLR
jgi:DNA-binding transcriptional LysR family regulator